jgi:hypothetical protein
VPHFSLVIIGSGSGNLVVPKDPAQGRVALIESAAFGGTCANRGCIRPRAASATLAPGPVRLDSDTVPGPRFSVLSRELRQGEEEVLNLPDRFGELIEAHRPW